jgi:4-aminobutyrate aminotransferase-like enzyme
MIGQGHQESIKRGSGFHQVAVRSLAAGLATINFIEKNELVLRARELGTKAMERLKAMAERSRFIGDVRGKGLFIGVEFVEDKNTKEPALKIIDEMQKKIDLYEKGLSKALEDKHYAERLLAEEKEKKRVSWKNLI